MIIHFTPKAVIDLLRYLKPELRNKAIIDTADYYEDLTKYFNETVRLDTGGALVTLTFSKANLTGHNATFVLKLVNIEDWSGNLDVSVHSFTDVYKRIQNHVILTVNGERSLCVLNAENRKCIFQNKVLTKRSVSYNWYVYRHVYAAIMIILVLGVISLYGIRRLKREAVSGQ